MKIKKEFDTEVGNRIYELREKKGYTKEQLAELADISVSHVHNIENGNSGFTTWILYRLSQIFDVSTDYLLSGQGSDLKSTRITKLLADLNAEKRVEVEDVIIRVIKISL